MKSIIFALLLAGNTNTADVKYIAGNNGEFFFDVVYTNAAGSRFSLAIQDEYGNQLYQAFYSDKQFDKKFKLADPESFGKLTFVIRNYGDNSVQRFEVNSNNRLVEDVEVKEIVK